MTTPQRPGADDDRRCPRCNSPSPERHPAVQFEGEVHLCPHPWHATATPSNPARQAMTGADDERLVILDWRVLLASLVHFGRSHDGAVEHDLEAAITEIEQQRDRCRDAKATEVQRREAAEAEVGRLRAPVTADLREAREAAIEAAAQTIRDFTRYSYEEQRTKAAAAALALDVVEGYVRALSTTAPQSGWRHKKRGSVYSYVGDADVQVEAGLGEGDQVVVYRGSDGRLWVRPHHEFHDGRFERLPSPTEDATALADRIAAEGKDAAVRARSTTGEDNG